MVQHSCSSVALASAIIILIPVFAFLFFPAAGQQLSAAPSAVYSSSLSTSGDMVVAQNMTLTSDLVAANLTIESGVTLRTDGHSVIVQGVLANYGTIAAGYASDGGTVLSTGAILNALNYTSSYGGSGGGASLGVLTLLSSLSGSTLSPGGLNGLLTDGGSGSSPSSPQVSSSLMRSWYSGGFQNYLAGAGGAGGYSSGSVYGGNGSYGIYIQANSVIAGTIYASGESITRQPQDFTAGAGGGGVVVIAYGSGGYVPGTYDVSGGISVSNINNSGFAGGSGGNGAVVTLSFGSGPPITVSIPLFQVSFTESGLPSGSNWSVDFGGTVLGTTTQSIVFNEPNGTYSYSVLTPGGFSAHPSSGTVSIQGTSANVQIAFSPQTYAVTFAESGLPQGTTWFVNLTNGQSFKSSTSSMTFNEPNGTYVFMTGSSAGNYYPVPATGTFVIVGSGASVNISWIAFTGANTTAPYRVLFVESGLPPGTNWSVTLNGTEEWSLNNSISFQEVNGSYSFTVGREPGYVSSPSTGTISVNGAGATLNVSFEQNISMNSGKAYAVTFVESGLPPGTNWSVTLNGTSLSSSVADIVFGELNGTYEYTVGYLKGYHATSYSGTVTVNGTAQNVSINWKSGNASVYTVTFVEFGLPSGTEWSLRMNGVLKSSTTSSIVFEEPNGTYFYAISQLRNFTSLPQGGSLVVSGQGTGVSVSWSPGTRSAYEVTFVEEGLPFGALWRINLSGGIGFSSTNTAILFVVPNGTYFYSITTADSGFAAADSSGSFVISGHALTAHVAFNRRASGQWIVGQLVSYWPLVAAVVIIGSVSVVMMRRRVRKQL